jgi:hypothetical protein
MSGQVEPFFGLEEAYLGYKTFGAIGDAAGAAWGSARGLFVTESGLATVEAHLARFGADEANAAMVTRLRSGLRTEHDIAFYRHEIYESSLMRSGMEARAAHLNTLEWQGIPYVKGYEQRLYHPDVLKQFPDSFR